MEAAAVATAMPPRLPPAPRVTGVAGPRRYVARWPVTTACSRPPQPPYRWPRKRTADGAVAPVVRSRVTAPARADLPVTPAGSPLEARTVAGVRAANAVTTDATGTTTTTVAAAVAADGATVTAAVAPAVMGRTSRRSSRTMS